MPGWSHLEGPNTNRDQPGGTSGDPTYGVMATFDRFWWRDNYDELEGVLADRGYEYFEPAFMYGWEACRNNPGCTWNDIEPELAANWERDRERASAKWDEVKHATRHAFERAVHIFQHGKNPDATVDRETERPKHP